MAIRDLNDLRRQAGTQWQDSTDEDLISAYADFIKADPTEVANRLGYKPSEAGLTGQRFGAAFDRYQAGLYGLGEAVTGGLGFRGAEEALATRRRANEFEAAVASRAARELGGVESWEDVQGIRDVPSYIAGLAIQSTPYIAEAAAGGLATRGLMSGTRAAFGQAVQAGDIPAAQAARQTLRRGMTVGGAAATYPSSVGEILQAQREQAGTTDLGVAGALGVPFAALNVLGIEGAAARLGGFRSIGRALDEVPGIRGAVTRAGATGLRVGTQESIAEVGQEGVSQFGRMAVDPQEEFFSPEAQDRFKESAIGGFLLGKSLGAAAGGWRRSGEPIDLTRNIEPQVRQADAEARGLVRPGAGLSTQDLINQITGVTRPEGIRPTRESMEAALNEPTGQMVAGPGGIERPQTAGDLYGVPSAPAAQAGAPQQAAQQTQGAQQAAQIEQAVIQQTAQTYGVRQVPPGPGVPTQAFNIAGRTVIGVPRVNQIVREIAQANQNKSPERVQLEAAIVASGLPLSGQPTSKSILSSIDGAIKKYQLDGAATLNDAAQVLEFQIGQAKSAKAAEPMARIYEALTGQMSAAFQQLMEGPTPAATVAPLTPPASLGLMTGQAAPTPTPAAGVTPTAVQPTGALSGQPTPRAAAPAPTAAPAPAAQAQPVPAAQRVSPAPSPRAQEVTAGAQAWEDMNVSTVQYSDLSEQDRAAWDQAVAEGRATGEAQEQLAKEYELIQEQGFMQQVLDRIIGRVIKSPNKARYFSTFLAAGARQQDIIARAEANAQRGADGKLTEAARAEIKRLNQSLSALRGAPNPELAAEYGVALDTLKEWNKELRSFLIAKAPQLQEAARVVSVELKLEGGDLRNILSSMVARNQQAQTELQEAVQPDEVVFDERDLAVEDAGVTAQERTAASVQEVFNASETINARYLRLQQELVDAENAGNQELADEITAKLDALTEDAAKQATKQTAKRPVKEKKDAVQKRETEKVSVQPGARGGEKVGKEVRGAEKPAATGEAKTEREVTEAEKATEKSVRESPAPINEKVAPLVSALNKQNIPTVLSGDLYGLDLVYVDIAAPWNTKIPGLPRGWFAGPNSALHTQAVTGDPTVGEVWKNPETAVEELKLQNMPVQLRLARPGGAVSEAEAQQVTAAVKAALRTTAPTTAETAESAWTELRSSLPQEIQESIPAWRNLTKAQKDAATEFGADLNMRNVERIVGESTPPQNAMRRRAEQAVQELTNTKQSLLIEDASLDEMADAYIGVQNLRNRFNNLGISNAFNAVGQFYVSYNRNVNWDGIITNVDQKVAVILRQDIAVDRENAMWAMAHEVGHAVDQVIQGGDTFSADPRLNLRFANGKIVPFGVVAQEMAALRKINEDVKDIFAYPLDPKEAEGLSSTGVRQELFAQIWALYTSSAAGQKIIEDNAPSTAAFMKEVLARVQETTNFQATNLGQQAAFDSRAEGFDAGRRGVSTPTLAEQVAAAQQNIPIVRSINASAAGNVLQLPPTVKSSYDLIAETVRNWTRKGIDRVVFTEALIKRAVESGISAANEFKNLIQERGVMARKLEQEVEKIADMYALVPESDRGTGEFSVNTFIYDSTRTKKWGFQPKWRTTAVTVDPDMRDRFNALKPESQAFIRAVFQHGDKMLALKKKSVMDFTNSEYDAQIKLAQADGNAELVASLQKDKIADLKKFDTLFKLREGIPYAPLRRVGKYAVVAKSPEFRAAEEKGDNKTLRQLEQDPNHYHVSFVDTDIQARNLQRQLRDQGFYGTDQDAVYFFEREKFQDELYGGDSMLAALSKLRSRVEDTDRDPKITAQLRRTITDMYLHALADASARKSELRRRAVPGEIDMLQSFTLQGRADAHFLSAVQYNDQTQQALQRMRKQSKTGGDRTRKAEVLNELTGRYLQSLEYEPTALVQKLTRVSSIYFLASSPGYYLQNLTQPWMMSLPVMAGRHDYIKSANAIYNAYFDLKEVMKSAKIFDQQFDFSKVPDDVKEVIETLVNRSQIDIGLSTEMGEFRIEGQGPVSDRWNKVDKALRLAVQKVESINRLSTAIAAYRLELAKTGDKAGAIDYASSIINDTHGDYSGFNAPRFFNTNIGKVALQFRKFQLIQLGLLAKLFKNSFGKAVTREQKVEQATARRALTYILGQTAIITGVMGMPGAAAIAWALEGLFGDEDEPLDIKGSIRDFIGNDDIANLVLYGTPNLAGVNLSGKIGMGNALSVMPFTEIKDINGEKTAQIVGTLLGGPALGMGMRMADGYAYIAAGDLYKGMELMLPKGVGDAMRGVRVYSEGFTNRRGDELLSADQIGEVTLFWQGLGLTPTLTSVRGEKQGRVINLEQKFSDRSSSIKRAYAEAAKDRNNERMAELRADWRNLQEARVRNGYPRRPMSELLRAPQEQRQRERQVAQGVPYTESSRRFVERIANQ